MGYDSLIHDYQDNEMTWSVFMIIIGFANEVHTGIIIAYATVFALKYEDAYEFALFTCFVLGVSILARSINAKWWVVYPYNKRIYCVCVGFILAYSIMILAYMMKVTKGSEVILSLISLAAVISTFSASIGEAAMLGYLKGIP